MVRAIVGYSGFVGSNLLQFYKFDYFYNSKNFIDKCLEENNEQNITHIFMTDGDVTSGSSDIEVLKNKTCFYVSNIFIGFGTNHNAYMLNSLGSYSNNSYYFIDALEKSGMVYGEILHSILYKVFKNCIISIANGFIYDWKNNSWVISLEIGDIVSEVNKCFHLICDDPLHVLLKLTSENLFINEITSISLAYNIYTSSHSSYFTKYKFRQQTQQILHEVNVYNFKNKSKNIFEFEQLDKNTINESNNILKDKMNYLINEMTTYMDLLSPDNNTERKFIKLLCDDINICYLTLGQKNGHMFSCARQTSQGNQRIYNVSAPPSHIDNLDNHDSKLYELNLTSIQNDTPYMTQQALNLMTFVTNGRLI